jgi:hypothetical protein
MLTMVGMLIVIAGVAAVSSAQAQTASNRIDVKVPFEFVVADQKFPAGDYSISRAQPQSGDTILLIRSRDGHEGTARLTIPVETLLPKDKDKVVFQRYGDQYFLAQIWEKGSTAGRAFVKSRSQQEIR